MMTCRLSGSEANGAKPSGASRPQAGQIGRPAALSE
jgi:hypothetical protein